MMSSSLVGVIVAWCRTAISAERTRYCSRVNPRFLIFFACVLMFVACAMMVGQQQWMMLAIAVPVWLAILGFWVYRQRTR